MICTTREGRSVEVEIEYGDSSDDGTFISSGVYLDADELVSEETLDELSEDYAGELEERWLERQYARAESLEER